MLLASFKGGVHPPENKKLTEHKEFENLSVPHICRIPMQQHIGKPALPVVEKGDVVKEGDLIGKADGFISARVHASIPGKIIDIGEYPTPFSARGLCVVVEAEGGFPVFNNSDTTSWQDMDSKQLLDIIGNAGIVGLGGAAFPTHVKLSPPENKKIDTLVVNAAECEPYLTVDDHLTRAYPEQIIEGIRITLKILNISKAVIGIENNTLFAAKKFKETLEKLPLKENISVKVVKTKYPQGAEKQLIKTLLKREVPSGGLPMDIKVVVQNVGTIYAIYQAIVKNKPLYERYITVSGDLVKKPGNYKVRLGTLISDIMEECGGLKAEPAKVVLGGPMCGLAISRLDMPVVKGTSGILFLSEKETSVKHYSPCIRCGRCVAICPVNIMPNNIGNAVEKNKLELTKEMHPFDCIMCGACAYICPSRRPLNHFIKLAQQYIRNNK